MTTKKQLLSVNERTITFLLLLGVFIFILVDLLTDSREQLKGLHLIVELGIGVFSFLAILFFVYLSIKARRQLNVTEAVLVKTNESLSTTKNELEETQIALQISEKEKSELKTQSETWKAETNKFILGLSDSIDRQLEKWGLTLAEKEVALLLLKGLGVKEIAYIRNVSEKTVRAQATGVYTKSKLNGRSELAAFFLEDLLAPKSFSNEK